MMKPDTGIKHILVVATLAICTMLPKESEATIVEFQTVMGTFEVNLYDNATPATVTNFLEYVNSGAYTNTLFHRSVSDFVVQGGGFLFDMQLPLNGLPANASIANEPVYASVRGTIAMAKLAGNPDSATSQWFFNLSNNSGGLDDQNGGFTVFGEVVGNGMDVVTAIANLQTFDLGGALAAIPLRDYSSDDFNNNVPVEEEHLILVSAIIVTDSTVDSAAGLNPTPTTRGSGGGNGGGGGGGGAFGFWMALALLSMQMRRLARRAR